MLNLIAFGGFVQAQSNVIDEVIWVVGDDAILRSDVENMRLRLQLYKQNLNGDPYCIIPEQMAVQKLYLHQAKLDSIEISESQIVQLAERQINYAISQIGSKEKLEEYYEKPINLIREEQKQIAKEENMIQQMQRKLIGDIKSTPSEIRAFFNRIPQDSLPFIPTTVEVEIITMEPTIALAEIDEIKRKLREFTEQIISGQREFSTLARLYSEDIESSKRGGELGFTGKASLVPEFATAAFELNDPKKVSRIVETEYGYHIIQLIEKRGDRINVRHILLKPHVTKEELETAALHLDSIRTDIVNDKFTFEEAATYISHDKNTRKNKGLMVNNSTENYSERTGTSRFEMEELPPEVAKAIAGMQVDNISKPFTMINSNQKEVVAIVKLKSKVLGHKASLAEDFQALKEMLEQEKREKILEKWIAQKQKDTYIRINDNWKNCDFQTKGWIVE
jgi:peptidyl-prolyl cis-trans isomerase SurA